MGFNTGERLVQVAGSACRELKEEEEAATVLRVGASWNLKQQNCLLPGPLPFNYCRRAACTGLMAGAGRQELCRFRLAWLRPFRQQGALGPRPANDLPWHAQRHAEWRNLQGLLLLVLCKTARRLLTMLAVLGFCYLGCPNLRRHSAGTCFLACCLGELLLRSYVNSLLLRPVLVLCHPNVRNHWRWICACAWLHK